MDEIEAGGGSGEDMSAYFNLKLLSQLFIRKNILEGEESHIEPKKSNSAKGRGFGKRPGKLDYDFRRTLCGSRLSTLP